MQYKHAEKIWLHETRASSVLKTSIDLLLKIVWTAGLALFMAYAVLQISQLGVVQQTFPIYDSDNQAVGRPFLLKRFENIAATNANSTTPGSRGRWSLNEDPSGLSVQNKL